MKAVANLGISQPVLDWYEDHGRSLPWRVGPADRRRGLRPDAYHVWLSEIMLQQTTVKVVEGYYRAFLSRWPNVKSLAAAPADDVMAAWAGLGYYTRARNLIACAARIMADHGGGFPDSARELARLPGIGPYTSAAIAAIAFDEAVAVVDGNVERVIARHLGIRDPLPGAKRGIAGRLAALVPSDRPGEFAEALMDLGATICKPRKPNCSLCPLAPNCQARRAGDAEQLPIKAARKRKPTRHGAAFVALRDDGCVLLRRRPPRGLLGGMMEVPGSAWSESVPGDGYGPPVAADWHEIADPVAHSFTHFHLRLVVYRAQLAVHVAAPPGCQWISIGEIGTQALPTLMRKVIDRGLA